MSSRTWNSIHLQRNTACRELDISEYTKSGSKEHRQLQAVMDYVCVLFRLWHNSQCSRRNDPGPDQAISSQFVCGRIVSLRSIHTLRSLLDSGRPGCGSFWIETSGALRCLADGRWLRRHYVRRRLCIYRPFSICYRRWNCALGNCRQPSYRALGSARELSPELDPDHRLLRNRSLCRTLLPLRSAGAWAPLAVALRGYQCSVSC